MSDAAKYFDILLAISLNVQQNYFQICM